MSGFQRSLAVLLIQLALVDSWVADQPFLHIENAIRGVGLVVVTVAAFSADERVHAGLTIVAMALFAWFTAVALYW